MVERLQQHRGGAFGALQAQLCLAPEWVPLSDHNAVKAVFKVGALESPRGREMPTSARTEEFFIGDDGPSVATPSLYGDSCASDDALSRDLDAGSDDPDVCHRWRCRKAEAERSSLMREHQAEEAEVERLQREFEAENAALKAMCSEYGESISRLPQIAEEARGEVEKDAHHHHVRHAFLQSELDTELRERHVLQSQHDAEEAAVLKHIELAEKQLEQMALARRTVHLHLSNMRRMKDAVGEGILEEQRRRHVLRHTSRLKKAAEEREYDELMEELRDLRASHELLENGASDHHNELRLEIDEMQRQEDSHEARLADLEQQLYLDDLQSELAELTRERDELKARREFLDEDYMDFGQKLGPEYEAARHDQQVAEVTMASEARACQAELLASRQDYYSIRAGIRDMNDKAGQLWTALGQIVGMSGAALARNPEAQLSVTEKLRGALAKAEEEIHQQMSRRRDLDRRVEKVSTRQLRRAAVCCLRPLRAPLRPRPPSVADATEADYI